MTTLPDGLSVIQNTEKKRFELHIEGQIAFVDYMLAGTNIIFTHTEVPPELEGRGIGRTLAQHVLEYAVAQGYKIQPLCPFIAGYVRQHPEYQPHVW